MPPNPGWADPTGITPTITTTPLAEYCTATVTTAGWSPVGNFWFQYSVDGGAWVTSVNTSGTGYGLPLNNADLVGAGPLVNGQTYSIRVRLLSEYAEYSNASSAVSCTPSRHLWSPAIRLPRPAATAAASSSPGTPPLR